MRWADPLRPVLAMAHQKMCLSLCRPQGEAASAQASV